MPVDSRSNIHLPTSSMIRHDGFTSPEITESSLPYFLALTNFAFSSEAFRKYVLKLIEEGLDVPLSFSTYPHEAGWLLDLRSRINKELASR